MLKAEEDHLKNLCRRHNKKCTAQRREVFAYLRSNVKHPSVETVWLHVRRKMPDISLDSVYRILDDFAGMGVVRRLMVDTVMRYDANAAPHDHFLCARCGTMYDFSCLDDEVVRRACGRFGRVDAVDLQVRGVCERCLAAEGMTGN